VKGPFSAKAVVSWSRGVEAGPGVDERRSVTFSLLLILSAAPALDLTTLAEPSSLITVAWNEAPSLQPWRASIAQARAKRDKSHFLPNPGLDLSLNTLPLGRTNPPELAEPYLNIPNVQVGVSALVEIGKRGPRQQASEADLEATVHGAREALRQTVLQLIAAIGDVAAAELRVATLEGLASDARKLADVQAARAEKGDTSSLDADRARLEEEAAEAHLKEATEDLAQALRGCAAIIARPCTRFGDVARAEGWLDLRFSANGALEARPDVQALDATVKAANARQTLARWAAAPDPTVRVGYVHDRFVVSGNQQNSFFVGASAPLPLFDRGQADERAALAEADAASAERDRRLEAARAQLEAVGAQIQSAEARQQQLKSKSLPLALSVVSRLDAAVTRGSAPIQELLFARRTLAELSLTALDVDRRVFELHLERAKAGAPPPNVERQLDATLNGAAP